LEWEPKTNVPQLQQNCPLALCGVFCLRQFDLSWQLAAVKLCAPFNSSWVLLKSQGATDAAGGDEMFPGRREVAFSPSNSSGLLYRLGYIKNKM
jgi:hypothetical protein